MRNDQRMELLKRGAKRMESIFFRINKEMKDMDTWDFFGELRNERVAGIQDAYLAAARMAASLMVEDDYIESADHGDMEANLFSYFWSNHENNLKDFWIPKMCQTESDEEFI